MLPLMFQVFESGDIEAIANKLFSMQKSLAVLLNVVDYEDKRLQLEGLKNRLEAIASPKLVQALTATNLGKFYYPQIIYFSILQNSNSTYLPFICIAKYLEQSKIYVDIFNKMERLPQLLKYHHNCLKVSLGQEWRRTIELAQDENVSYWLHAYYDKLLSNWHDQVAVIFKLFCYYALTDRF